MHLAHRNQVLERKNERAIVFDFFPSEEKKAPLLIFCHGFKGFKDWGNWNDMALFFQEQKFHFLKFNFSLNGGTVENPIDFPDLEAFSLNSYSAELNDLDAVMKFVQTELKAQYEIEITEIILIGHSRGGSISILNCAHTNMADKLITLAAPFDLAKRMLAYDLDKWREEGVQYIQNGRTNQSMPLAYSFYEDFKRNEKRLNIPFQAAKISIPTLIIHAKNDQVVPIEEALNLNKSIPNAHIHLLNEGGHTFGSKHPPEKMPATMKELNKQILKFIRP